MPEPTIRVQHQRAAWEAYAGHPSAFLDHAVVFVVDLAGWQVFIESPIDVALTSIAHGALCTADGPSPQSSVLNLSEHRRGGGAHRAPIGGSVCIRLHWKAHEARTRKPKRLVYEG